MTMDVGGYLTGWRDADRSVPKDGEWIIFSCKAGEGWWRGKFNAKRYYVELSLQPFMDKVLFEGWESVDYWMRVPPKPSKRIVPYIIGDNYAEEEKPLVDLIKRQQECERQECGMTSEEIADELGKHIEMMKKLRKLEIE